MGADHKKRAEEVSALRDWGGFAAAYEALIGILLWQGPFLRAALQQATRTVKADRQTLTSALVNLLQNAFEFTEAQGAVTQKSFSLEDRVLIEVEDECGGLHPGDPEDLFKLFEQRNVDRSVWG